MEGIKTFREEWHSSLMPLYDCSREGDNSGWSTEAYEEALRVYDKVIEAGFEWDEDNNRFIDPDTGQLF